MKRFSAPSKSDSEVAESIRALSAYAHPDLWKSCLQLTNTFVPFCVLWGLMVVSQSRHYWATLLLAVPSAFLLVRLFIFQHDCGHGSFFSSRRANDGVGTLLGILTLVPYHYWRRTHAIHHATHGDLERRGFGDIDTLTVKEYLALSRGRRLAYRIVRNPLVLLVFGPTYQFLIKHRFPLDAPRHWKREWRSVHLTNVGMIALTATLVSTVGLIPFLKVQIPVFLIAGSLGIWLFYVQHQFEGAYWAEKDDWSFYSAAMEGSSFYDLPPFLHWLTGHIGIHHVHHLCSHIPNYHLRRCMAENPEMQNAPRLTLRESLGCLRLKLWDEKKRRLVSFGELRRTSSS